MSTEASANAEVRRSFAWRTLAAVAGMVSSFLLTVVVVRSLDDRDAATFFAILAALAVGPLFGRFGLGLNVVRLMPAEPDAQVRRRIAATHLQATVVLSCLSAPVIALIACNGLFGHPEFVWVFVLTTALIVVESTRLMLSDIFAAAGRIAASSATMHYIRSLLVLPCVAFVIFVLHRLSLLAVLETYLGVAVAQLVVALIYARKEVALFHFPAGISTLRMAIGQGAQIFSLDFSTFMMMQGTIWLATAAFSPLHATQYSAAATLAMQVTVLESLSALAVAPAAARLWAAGNRDGLVRTLSNAATLNAFVVVGIVGMLALFGPTVLELFYGTSIRPAGTLLLILATSGIFQALFNVSITMLEITGQIRAAAGTALAVLVVVLPCAVAAAWLGGPIALAVVSSVGVSAMYTCQWLTARRLFDAVPRAHSHLFRAAREILRDAEPTTA